jgi:hypothetical protein
MLLDSRLDLGLDRRLVRHQRVGAGQAVEQMGGAELLVLRHVLVRFMTKGQLRFAAARGSVGGTVTRCSWY